MIYFNTLSFIVTLTYFFFNGVSCNGCVDNGCVDFAVWCLLCVDCGGWSCWRMCGACAVRCLSFACAWMCMCVPRAGCVAAGIWIGAVTGRCAAVVCSRVSFGVSH